MAGVRKFISCIFFADLANDAMDVINLGEIVYWSAGKAIAIGFGKTPISQKRN